MRSFGIRFLITLLIFCLAFPFFTVNAQGEAAEIVLSFDGEAYRGATMVLTVSVKKPAVALAGLEFTLAYDSKYVKPQIVENNESTLEMDALVKARPNGWEQISSHKEGIYTFRFAMPDNGKDLLDNANELVLDIPFTVISAGSFDFSVASDDIIAVANDKECTVHTGKGSNISVVAASEAQKIGIELKGDDTANEKGDYLLRIEALNLGDASGIVALEFDVAYDKSVFEPVVTTNKNEEMNSFMQNMPGDWEQMCSFDAANGKYTLRFAAKNAESLKNADVLKSGETAIFTIPFKVIGSEGDVASFTSDSASVIGISCENVILTGNGSVKSVSVEKAPASTIPDDLGYIIKDGFLMFVDEKTKVSDFLSPLGSGFSVNSKGEYICTGDVLTDGNAINLIIVVRGDINGSGNIEKYDYILVKRYCMNTVSFNDTQLLAADATDDGKIDRYDYIRIKRHCLGTFIIKGDR